MTPAQTGASAADIAEQAKRKLILDAQAVKQAEAASIRYRIQGGTTLKGDVVISGSKNAALPLLAGSILCKEGEMTYTNVPRLRDIEVLLKILQYLGAETSFEENTVKIRADKLQSRPLPRELVSMLRASIVLLGPMLARFGEVEMAYPGGDVIGKRPVHAHIAAFQQMGAEDLSTNEYLKLRGALRPGHLILPEFSVTATENALLAAAMLPGETRIDLAAGEPHVQDCAKLVKAMGAEVEGAGTHTIVVRGRPDLKACSHAVTPDYLEAGSFVMAALCTHGKVRLHNLDPTHLLSFLDAVRRMGGTWRYDSGEGVLFVDGEVSSLNALTVKTNIYPGFPTDLLAPVGVAMTQAKGVSRIFERLYEGRMAYLYELEKMGAQIEILNSHQALIIGPTALRGRTVVSNDVRAGAAMVLAGMIASGETVVTDVQYIERGYDRLELKLKTLGAKIVRETA
jgi:UDP-N-acetylglucosamine 1-carboxyvinyltransferase